jgi:hypothetical protein
MEGRSMKNKLMRTLNTFLLTVTLGVSMNANSAIFGFGSDSWQEEVLLHDGQKMIVKRSQSYGGRHEIGQSSPIKEHSIEFTLPGSNKTITWTSEYGEDLGRTNFNLLAVHVLNSTPYLVVEPNLCLSYNKWGRPNPPYVFFKYDAKAWQRIPLEEFPVEFKTINVTLTLGGVDVTAMVRKGVVPTKDIQERNSRLTQPEFRSIVRDPIKGGMTSGCMEEIRTGDGWMSLDWFSSQKTSEACLKICEREKVTEQNCPCNRLFKGK